jgi:hypothetical protein
LTIPKRPHFGQRHHPLRPHALSLLITFSGRMPKLKYTDVPGAGTVVVAHS